MSGFGRKYFHIAGSANAGTQRGLIRFAHDVVRSLVDAILVRGGGVICAAGAEPLQDASVADSPSLVFDWTVLFTACEVLARDLQIESPRPPVVVVVSEKAEQRIPSTRRDLWNTLLEKNWIKVEQIPPGATSGAMIRDRQASFGDVLVCFGGGVGVEHLAETYMFRRKPVIPFDIPLGASRGDGSGGAGRLYREARTSPTEYLRLLPEASQFAGTLLAGLATRNVQVTLDDLVRRFIALVERLDHPTAFYVRLLNPDFPEFAEVENFFRSTVDPVIDQLGYRRIEMGTDRTSHGFMNVAIFESIRNAELCIVDITGHRPNCFIELGYSLAGTQKVIVSAKSGTPLPFDQQAVPCFFWSLADGPVERIAKLKKFIDLNINRPPIVSR